MTQIYGSFSWSNFEANRQIYDALHGSEYTNFQKFQADYFRELLDFHVIQEFNVLKGKPFMPFSAFSEVYQHVQSTPKNLDNSVSQMVQRLKDKNTSVILVSGIPGAGKGRFAASLSKQLLAEGLNSCDFKMPTVQASLKYSTQDFIAAL